MKKHFRWLAVLLAIVLVAAACGGDDDDSGDSASDGDSAAALPVYIGAKAPGAIVVSISDGGGIAGEMKDARVRPIGAVLIGKHGGDVVALDADDRHVYRVRRHAADRRMWEVHLQMGQSMPQIGGEFVFVCECLDCSMHGSSMWMCRWHVSLTS